MKSIKCKLGMHKWSEPRFRYISGSNVKDFKKRCLICGKEKKWTEPIKDAGECC